MHIQKKQKKNITLMLIIILLSLIYIIIITENILQPTKNNNLQKNKINNLTNINFHPDRTSTLKSIEQELEKEIKEKSEETIYNQNEVALLARLIQSEALGEPYKGKVAVGAVVINRMNKANKSMKQIIYAKNQFSGVGSNLFNRNPSNECVQAAKEALDGHDPVNGARYFINKNICGTPSWIKNLTYVKRIENHWFYK